MGVNERFDAKTVLTPAGCLVWTACGDRDGYGTFWFQGRFVRAHRWAYERHHGPIPDGLGVLHHCDNPPCVNPVHLFVGTNADNTRDRDAKGRGGGHKTAGNRNGSRLHPERLPRGETHPGAVLTGAQVIEVRRRYAAGGVLQRDLAVELGVSQTLVSAVVRRIIWRDVA